MSDSLSSWWLEEAFEHCIHYPMVDILEFLQEGIAVAIVVTALLPSLVCLIPVLLDFIIVHKKFS